MTTPNETERPIFRASALARREKSRTESFLPRYLEPRRLAILWALLALLGAAGGLAFTTRVPVFVAGKGVVLASAGRPELAAVAEQGGASAGRVLLVFLPASEQGRLAVGQPLFARNTPDGERTATTLVAVDAEPSSPAAVRARFDLAGAAAAAVDAPCIVALARAPAPPAGLAPEHQDDAVVSVEVEVRKERVLSLVPGFGRLAGDGR